MRMQSFAILLAPLLSLSSVAEAITYQFVTTDVTGGEAELEATLVLNEPVDTFLSFRDFFGVVDIFIDPTPPSSFQRFELSYEFSGVGQSFVLTPTELDLPFRDLDSFDFDIGFSRPSELFHTTTADAILGFAPSFLGPWEFNFLSDNFDLALPVLSGRFVAVPEPGSTMIFVLGLIVATTLRRRSARA